MPPKTASPIEIRLAAPAPLDNTNGMTPSTNEIAVMITALNLNSAPCIVASKIDLPSSLNCLENSTIKMAFFEASPINIIKPT